MKIKADISAMFRARHKDHPYLWFTSLAVGDEARISSQKNKGFINLRPFLGLLRYCLIDLPFRQSNTPETDIIFMSVFTWQKNAVRETYYGDLPAILHKDNLRPILLGKIAEHYSREKENDVQKAMTVPAYCPTHILTKLDGLACILKGLISLSTLRGVWKDIFYAASFELPMAFIYIRMLEKIYKTSPHARLIFPLEGNAWEGACLYAAKDKIHAAYQHAAILPEQTKLTPHKGRPLPAQIISTGTKAREILENFGYDRETLRDGFSLRQSEIYRYTPKTSAPSEVKNILLLMQGGEDKNGILDLCADFCRKNPSITIDLRPHPAMDINKLSLDDGLFDISKEAKLHDDILAHDICLYTSSTGAMESVYLGVPVIRLTTKDANDPLFLSSHLKKEAGTVSDMTDACRFFENYKDFEKELGLARSYFEQYFTQPPEDMKDRFKKWLSL